MARPTTARSPPRRRNRSIDAIASLVAALALYCALDARPAAAQQVPNPSFGQKWVGIPEQPPTPAAKKDPNAQMLVKADEIHYDTTNHRVEAVGNVQIYYSGSRLEANKVVYDQATKRLHAEGNVWLREADGKIVNSEVLDLNDDYRDGFIDSLRLETVDKTRFAAPSAQRTGDKVTVFNSGVYTACEPCKDDPLKPPKWQVKAVRIIHDEVGKMIYFENARLEAFGIPLFWFPYLSAPDPTVKRASGFLTPTISSSGNYGAAVTIPYYWALSPYYDITLAPMITSSQGVLMQGEWRQRLENGAFDVRAAGISQTDPQLFTDRNGANYPGARTNRGSLESSGQFLLNDKWVWGWDAMLLSDKTFFQDYGLGGFRQTSNSFHNMITETGTSQLYVAGRGDRSYFDARVVYTLGLSLADTQSQLPVIRPVVDYGYTFGQPILGGEVGFKSNLTSLSRETAEFDAINQISINNNLCAPTTADPAIKTAANCLLRGIPGDYSRASGELTWRRTITDSYGQVFTPFVVLRGDVATASITNEAGVSNFIAPGETTLGRAMPAVGVEYRYPFIGVQSWGTQTIEPIAQLIVRPNETNIGKLPNEDAQSLIFGDDNLVQVNKFSGWDRVEGGTRANVAMQYTAQFNQGGTINALFGQSYQLWGTNSFAVPDTANTGLGSGLDTARSDYVARMTYQPDKIYAFTSRFRFDQQTWAVQRAEFEGRATFDRWSATLLYGNYAAQPQIGFLSRRDGVLGSTTVKLTPNWSVLTSARYDIGQSTFDQYRLGVGYIDDCFALSMSYITDYSYGFSPTTNTSIAAAINHTVMLQLSLRTLGDLSFAQKLGQSGAN